MARRIIHGMEKTKIYKSWQHMKQRCGNPNNKDYKNYGARGITYDVKWKDFLGFYEDMGSSHKDGLTIERIDVNGNYNKDNCKWATKKEQSLNTRRNRFITFNGKTQTLQEWANELNLLPDTIYMRIKNGWSLEETMTSKKRINQYK